MDKYPRERSWRWRAAGVLMALGLALGLTLVALPAAYFSYAAFARSQLPKLEASLEPAEYRAWVIQPQSRAPGSPEEAASAAATPPTPTPVQPTPVQLPKEEAVPAPTLSSTVWARPAPAGDETAPQHMRIPSIGVNSAIKVIRQVVEDGKLFWERPSWVVGQLEGTPNPGQGGNTVMAGHLESPRLDEGNVFENLPDVRLLDPIYVETERARYEYRVVQKRVVYPEASEVLADTADATLTLITCVPKGVYSHRLVVIAKLFKVEDLAAPAASTRG